VGGVWGCVCVCGCVGVGMWVWVWVGVLPVAKDGKYFWSRESLNGKSN
jgi:hypothetical protein